MKKKVLVLLFGLFSVFTFAQQTLIKGSVKDAVTLQPIPDVTITIEATSQSRQTDAMGKFVFSANVPLGEQVLSVSKNGYLTKRYPVVVNESGVVDISDMTLEVDVTITNALFTITLSDDELNDDTSGSDNISGLLSSSMDVFQRTAAFEFSSSFFRLRGLDSDNGSVLINGIEMNKLYNGRPQWSNWGGLNDMVRNQELTTGLTPSAYNFGGVLGTTNMNTRASNYRQGGQITYSSSNRSYTNRAMASYATGLMDDGWAIAVMLSRRWGNEGYQDASLYDANSFFASVEKQFNDKHSLNFTSIYAPNRRGKSSPNTQEVYDLKGIRYNEYWGWQEGEKRNSRIKDVNEPVLMLNHYWNISNKTTLNTNIGYQFGKIGNSRLDYGGTRLVGGVPVGNGSNPSPAYYQKLPSYWLTPTAGPDYSNAYLAEQEFLNDGQIDWNSLYQTNLNNVDGYSTYILYEDRNDDKQWTFNSILNHELNENTVLNATVNYKTLKSENFAEIIDLLGGSGFLNVDAFDGFQFDLQNPDEIAIEGEKFKYNYNLNAHVLSGYAQAQFKYNKIDFYVSGSVTKTNYQREGLYDNEANPGNSLGKSNKADFMGFGAKGGFTYKLTGKHLFDVNVGYIARAPSLQNTFSNARVNNSIVPNISEEKITAFDASYIFRSPIVKAKITGFYAKTEDANEISFYYADGVTGFTDSAEFVSEILQDIDKEHIGAEIGIDAQVTPTIKLKGAASIGQYTYTNNPNLILTANAATAPQGKAYLNNYKVAGGPQGAYSVGFEYRDPDYWWFGATANVFTNTYLDISPITRTANFYTDPADGLPFNDYDEAIARDLLKQEKFDNYMVVNLVGGKSWKIDDYYVGFFASIGNVFNEKYKTGGFEQGRAANYRELLADASNEKRVFGPKYWYGRGANYFLNFYFRF
ncbi:MAG: carboxypeptidase regulatory-like domain-containing protein [Flavobacteriaceae bacterium]